MRAWYVPLWSVGLWIGLASSSLAFDPATTDILGLRLGMNEEQIAAILARQGVPPSRITRKTAPCPDDRGCETVINVVTTDGALTISLMLPAAGSDKPPIIHEIKYAFRGWGVDEPHAIAESVLEHFGRPTQTDPMMWCQHPPTDQHCLARQPALRFTPDKLVLVLTAGEDGT